MQEEKEDIVEELRERCIAYIDEYKGAMAELKLQQEQATKGYMAEPYGNELDGHSHFVTSDIMDTIEWLKPSLIRIFYSGKDVVSIEPIGREDEEGAQLLSQKVNHDFQKGLNGFLLFYDWFDDALKMKIGWVKYWWEEREEYIRKEYKELYDITELQADPEFIIDSVVEVQGYLNNEAVTTYNVIGKKVRKISRPMAEPVPAEQIIFNPKLNRVEDEEFIAHWKRMHKTVVASTYNIDVDELSLTEDSFSNEILHQKRFEDIGGATFASQDEDTNFVYLYECYINDYSTGYKVPKVITICGNKVIRIDDNKYGRPPFCCISPLRIAHRAVGISIADLVWDLQRLNTSLWRAVIENIYYQNNGVNVINPLRINTDDLMNNFRPGGYVRTVDDASPREALYPIPPNPLAPQTMAMFDRVVDAKENRTGITRYNQGNDSNSLNKTATGISQIMTAAQQRIELVARIIAETGVADLFKAFAEMNVNYMQESVSIKLNNKWLDIQKHQLDILYDVSINVGIGTGNKDMIVQQMMTMMDRTLPLVQTQVLSSESLLALMRTIYENMGYRNPDKYIIVAEQQPQQMQQQQIQQGVPQDEGANQENVQQQARVSPEIGATDEGGGGVPEDSGQSIDPAILDAMRSNASY